MILCVMQRAKSCGTFHFCKRLRGMGFDGFRSTERRLKSRDAVISRCRQTRECGGKQLLDISYDEQIAFILSKRVE
jgi:hypothetical protein